ncbi:Clan SC, family S33, methylesterase-like serine peptidase [Bifidobacterium tissieri]|uniref:Clan SC, family S33, methylesterase-like serine peptidase n=2 Tax=Bifidobacterium tissieri TaxID=1630162 RepID=A0A261FHM6_9BIFI|nr:Clan SC, family S33, methylesterase-like serine peptidase [Bifidobacterium tissieri]
MQRLSEPQRVLSQMATRMKHAGLGRWQPAISARHTVMLGGVPQKISVEGPGGDAPVMIMFHGGPWAPFIYGLAYRGFYPELSSRFTLVWWDQYGCGKNARRLHDIPADISVETFARMAIDLTDEIRRRFPNSPILLNGYSFGTYLTMQVAAARETDIAGAINLGPIMNMREATEHFRTACEPYLTDRERQRMLRLRNSGRYDPYAAYVERLAGAYTDCCHYRGQDRGKGGMIHDDAMFHRWLLRLITSGDYHPIDLIGAAMGTLPYGRLSRRFHTLWDSMENIDLWALAEHLDMPILYLQGDAERYVLPDELSALAARRSNVRYVRLDRSGHIPKSRAWAQAMREMIAFGEEITGCR